MNKIFKVNHEIHENIVERLVQETCPVSFPGGLGMSLVQCPVWFPGGLGMSLVQETCPVWFKLFEWVSMC